MRITINRDNVKFTINSLLFAALISFEQIGVSLQRHFNIESGMMLSFVILWLILFFFNNLMGLSIVLKQQTKILWIIYTLIVLFFSIVINGHFALRYFYYFILLGIPAFLITCYDYDQTIVFKACSVFFALYFIVYFVDYRPVFMTAARHAQGQMSVAYELGAIAILSFSFFWFTKELGYRIISFAELVLSIALIFMDTTTRGAILGLFVLFCTLLFANGDNVKKAVVKKTVVFFIGFFCAVIVLLFSKQILKGIYNFFDNRGLYLGFIHRLLILVSTSSGFGSGRTALYNKAFDMILKSPIIGSGVGAFEIAISGRISTDMGIGFYVHQHFLQILCETGIMGLLFHFFMTVQPIIRLFKHNIASIDDKALIGLSLFCIAIPRLMISNVYWITNTYWIFLFWLYTKEYSKETL